MHSLNHSAIANHRSVTCLTPQATLCFLSLNHHHNSQDCHATTSHCLHLNLSPTTCDNHSRPQHSWQQHVNATSAHEQAPTRWMQRCSTSVPHHPTAMALTVTGQQAWWMRIVRHFCYSLVSAPIILLWFLTWIPSATLPDDEHGCPPPTSMFDMDMAMTDMATKVTKQQTVMSVTVCHCWYGEKMTPHSPPFCSWQAF